MKNEMIDMVLSKEISDHKPLVKDGIISWNIMMQGKKTRHGYNNAFKLCENQDQYQQRLAAIVNILSQIVTRNNVAVIALQEAPILADDVLFFVDEIRKYTKLSGYLKILEDDALVTPWGIMTLVDSNQCQYSRLMSVWSEDLSVFNQRAQQLRIIRHDSNEGSVRDIINAHMPYRQSHNKPCYVSDILMRIMYMLSPAALPDRVTVAADFNVDPMLLGYNNSCVFSKKDNSLHLNQQENQFSENVDGIVQNPGNEARVQKPITHSRKYLNNIVYFLSILIGCAATYLVSAYDERDGNAANGSIFSC